MQSLLSTLLLLLVAACVRVDTTEYCVGTRYGNVTEQRATVGLNAAILTDYTCFPLTDQNYPDNASHADNLTVQTSDPVTLDVEVTMVYAFDEKSVYETFLEKRSFDAAEVEVLNGLRSGVRDAFAGWTVADVFSEKRAYLADAVRAHIQRKLGTRATLKNVFIRDLKAPESIEKARIAAAQQAQVLDQARKQAQIDSVNAAAQLFKARAEAETKRLQAVVYEQNPELLRLEVAKAQAGICANATTCILGGSVVDTWGSLPGRK